MKEFKVKITALNVEASLKIFAENQQNAIIEALYRIDPRSQRLRKVGGRWISIDEERNKYQLHVPQHIGQYIKFFRTGDIYQVAV